MPPSTVPTTPSHIFVDNAITVLEEATATALDAIEEDNLLQSQLSFRGIRIEDYEKTFVALTKAEAQIIHDRENYHAAQRVQETYDLLIRGKEDPDAPAQSLYWRTRCWEIATHHSKYQYTLHRPPQTAVDIPLSYQTDITGIHCPLVVEKPPDESVCSAAKRVRVRRSRTGAPASLLQIEGPGLETARFSKR